MRIKSILLLVTAALALAAAIPARAQSGLYGVATYISGGTNNLAQDSTNTYNKVIDLTDPSRNVITIEASFKAGAAGTSNVVFNFTRSLDNVSTNTYSSTPALIWAVPGNGTTLVTIQTNITVGAAGYYKLTTVENKFLNTFITNLTFRVSFKPGL